MFSKFNQRLVGMPGMPSRGAKRLNREIENGLQELIIDLLPIRANSGQFTPNVRLGVNQRREFTHLDTKDQ